MAITTSLTRIVIGLTVCFPAWAGTIVVGLPADPGSGDCIPFGCDYSVAGFGAEYQQVYTSSLFTGPLTITGLEFFNTEYNSLTATALTGTFDVFLSTTAADWNTLNATPASNIGPDETQVFSGSLAQPWAFGDTLTIPFSTPFTYIPGPDANLLLDVTGTGVGAGGLVFFDGNGLTGIDLPGSDMIFGIDYPTIHFFPHQLVVPGEGLVTGFDTTSQVSPEPGTFALLGLGLVGLGTVSTRLKRSGQRLRSEAAGGENRDQD